MMHTPPPDDMVHGAPPTKPQPSADQGITPPSQAPQNEPDSLPNDPETIDLSSLSPLAALKLLTATVESLVRKSTAGPPTPPASNPNTPRLQGVNVHECVGEEKEEHSEHRSPKERSPSHDSPNAHHHHDVPHPHKTPIGSPEAHPTENGNGPVPGAAFLIDEMTEQDELLLAQYKALSRKFYSKAPPPVPIDAYLRRLHTYCPMSPAVYLTAGSYIQRLAGSLDSSQAVSPSGSPSPPIRRASLTPGFALPVTPKTAHRLLLAALRVATKTLEDRNYPHARFAKVGGVSEKELARLEISLLFLLDFELLIKREGMLEVAKGMGKIWVEASQEGS